ncbi:MAG: hypothetical protein IPK98_03530 [Chloracidobacterium sp.]|nr:hypothetical protein [Chloracidobacterium sp.]
MITQRYVDSMQDMARTQNSKVIFMPMETSGVLASVGAFKEILPQPAKRRRAAKSAAFANELEK